MLEYFMRYAYINKIRVEPSKGQQGICPCCSGEVIAKCGKFKIHHWAHKTREHCDPWWENESEWHRRWKSYFPVAQQEFVLYDRMTGEKHVADVLSCRNVVLEFQSYPITHEEMQARELFYNQMVWVVNGAKREFDEMYFKMGICAPHTNDPRLRQVHWFGRSKLLAKWSLAKKRVYVDFGSDVLWLLNEFDANSKKGLVRAYPKQQFVEFFGGVFVPNRAFKGGVTKGSST